MTTHLEHHLSDCGGLRKSVDSSEVVDSQLSFDIRRERKLGAHCGNVVWKRSWWQNDAALPTNFGSLYRVIASKDIILYTRNPPLLPPCYIEFTPLSGSNASSHTYHLFILYILRGRVQSQENVPVEKLDISHENLPASSQSPNRSASESFLASSVRTK